uniref:(northern house mosquito) hypothetical protein n=1 Tax=Culex pipiens TaxID=7175 RepID=A0A8D8FB28_CULPI
MGKTRTTTGRRQRMAWSGRAVHTRRRPDPAGAAGAQRPRRTASFPPLSRDRIRLVPHRPYSLLTMEDHGKNRRLRVSVHHQSAPEAEKAANSDTTSHIQPGTVRDADRIAGESPSYPRRISTSREPPVASCTTRRFSGREEDSA